MTDVQPPAPAAPKRRRRDRARLALAIIVAVVATLFVAKNTRRVTIDWIVTKTDAPLILALGVAVLLGAALGALAVGRRRRGDDAGGRRG
jgi:uncharacterized integral membrane protein